MRATAELPAPDLVTPEVAPPPAALVREVVGRPVEVGDVPERDVELRAVDVDDVPERDVDVPDVAAPDVADLPVPDEGEPDEGEPDVVSVAVVGANGGAAWAGVRAASPAGAGVPEPGVAVR